MTESTYLPPFTARERAAIRTRRSPDAADAAAAVAVASVAEHETTYADFLVDAADE
ncbi:hypothetical protein [Curtobacterium sp. ISL-83]|uniref:hypothetical protein n=1 Tax=Curtobacterium sp. ISL-83 TaxID=2819145 RepID=UPI001BEA3927|nr:hypothetical protein [Curtobacterium sp. ISL-83]MBT2502513.1 hypothetical protein [Curtobacterium sp. ISL-83]